MPDIENPYRIEDGHDLIPPVKKGFSPRSRQICILILITLLGVTYFTHSSIVNNNNNLSTASDANIIGSNSNIRDLFMSGRTTFDTSGLVKLKQNSDVKKTVETESNPESESNGKDDKEPYQNAAEVLQGEQDDVEELDTEAAIIQPNNFLKQNEVIEAIRNNREEQMEELDSEIENNAEFENQQEEIDQLEKNQFQTAKKELREPEARDPMDSAVISSIDQNNVKQPEEIPSPVVVNVPLDKTVQNLGIQDSKNEEPEKTTSLRVVPGPPASDITLNDIKPVVANPTVPVVKIDELVLENKIESNTIPPLKLHPFPIEIMERAYLWLDAEQGVDTDLHGHVTKWTSRADSKGKIVSKFEPMAQVKLISATGRYNEELEKMMRRTGLRTSDAQLTDFKSDIFLQRISENSAAKWITSIEKSAINRPSVLFPCSLHSSSATQLTDKSTFFFVLSPRWLNEKISASISVGIKFFGHYPDGEFRFNKGVPSFFSNGFDFDYPDTDADGVIANKLMLLAYRFNSNVEISINGGAFKCASCESDGSTLKDYSKLFSPSVSITKNASPVLSPLTVGGVTPDQCGFNGYISEVLVFNEVLMNFEVNLVATYLAERYGIVLSAHSNKDDVKSSMLNDKVKQDKLEGGRLVDGLTVKDEETEVAKPVDVVKPLDAVARSMESNGLKRVEVVKTAEPVKIIENPKVENKNPSTGGVDGDGFKVDKGGIVSSSTACSGSTDPFADQSIERFAPPKGAGFSDIMQWDSARKEMIEGISKLKIGGNPLRKKISEEMLRMRLLRFQLFCKYVPA